MAQPPFSPSRLAKVLGMLGSQHEGEVLAAARQAQEMVRSSGLSWDRIIAAPIGTYAGAPDEPIPFNGRMLHPPHEGRWVATALFLFRQAVNGSPRITEADAAWVKRRTALWRQRAIHPHEAARLVAIYDAVIGGR